MNADVKPSKLTRHLIPQRAAVAIFNPSTSTSTNLTSASYQCYERLRDLVHRCDGCPRLVQRWLRPKQTRKATITASYASCAVAGARERINWSITWRQNTSRSAQEAPQGQRHRSIEAPYRWAACRTSSNFLALAGISNPTGLSGLLVGVNNKNILCREGNNNNNAIPILPID